MHRLDSQESKQRPPIKPRQQSHNTLTKRQQCGPLLSLAREELLSCAAAAVAGANWPWQALKCCSAHLPAQSEASSRAAAAAAAAATAAAAAAAMAAIAHLAHGRHCHAPHDGQQSEQDQRVWLLAQEQCTEGHAESWLHGLQQKYIRQMSTCSMFELARVRGSIGVCVCKSMRGGGGCVCMCVWCARICGHGLVARNSEVASSKP